jgi:hypothetical protein
MALFCDDRELGYLRSRTPFVPGEGVMLDEAYRLAHLPLVAPRHPRVFVRQEGKDYEMGRHERVWSLVAPVTAEALVASPAFRELEAELESAPFARKIAWDMLPRRRDKLHATICGSLRAGEAAPSITDEQRRALAGLGPIEVELRGLFSGNVNVGRLYLRAYPEKRQGENVFRRLQRLLGRKETDLYVVGIWNLVDDLDATQATALAALLARWWERPILRIKIDRLWLLGSRDDLALDSTIAQAIALA